jgi:hypothetical protein
MHTVTRFEWFTVASNSWHTNHVYCSKTPTASLSQVHIVLHRTSK